MKLPFSIAIRLWLVSQLLKQNIGVPGGEEFHPGTKNKALVLPGGSFWGSF